MNQTWTITLSNIEYMHLMRCHIYLGTDSGLNTFQLLFMNPLWPGDATKTFSEPVLTHQQYGSVAPTQDWFHRKCSRYQFIKWVWKIDFCISQGPTEIKKYLLPYGSLGPTGHDPFESQSTRNGSHHWCLSLFIGNFKMHPQDAAS